MALIFFDGFEYNNAPRYSGWRAAAAGNDGAVGNSARYVGGKSYGANYTDNYLQLDLQYYTNVSILKDVFVGFAFRAHPSSNTNIDILQMYSVTDKLVFKLHAIGEKIYISDGYGKLYDTNYEAVRGIWHYFEIRWKLDDTNGVIQFRANEELILNLSSISTVTDSGDMNYLRLDFNNTSNTGVLKYFDDFYIADETDNFDFIGSCRIYRTVPIADTVQKDFTPSAVGDSYLMLDENETDEATTFVSTETLGSRDLYEMSELPPELDEVYGLKVCMNAGVLAAATSFRPVISNNSAVNTGQSRLLNSSNGWNGFDRIWPTVFSKNPDGNVNWLNSTINSTLVGFEVIP